VKCQHTFWKAHALNLNNVYEYLCKPEPGDIADSLWGEYLCDFGLDKIEEGTDYPEGSYGYTYNTLHRLIIPPSEAVLWIIDKLAACDVCKERLRAMHTLRLMED